MIEKNIINLTKESNSTPTGIIDIVENGIYDVADIATANVNVSGASYPEYFYPICYNIYTSGSSVGLSGELSHSCPSPTLTKNNTWYISGNDSGYSGFAITKEQYSENISSLIIKLSLKFGKNYNTYGVYQAITGYYGNTANNRMRAPNIGVNRTGNTLSFVYSPNGSKDNIKGFSSNAAIAANTSYDLECGISGGKMYIKINDVLDSEIDWTDSIYAPIGMSLGCGRAASGWSFLNNVEFNIGNFEVIINGETWVHG